MPFAFAPGAPYIEAGFHDATVDEVKTTLVDSFAESATRREIFERWTKM